METVGEAERRGIAGESETLRWSLLRHGMWCQLERVGGEVAPKVKGGAELLAWRYGTPPPYLLALNLSQLSSH